MSVIPAYLTDKVCFLINIFKIKLQVSQSMIATSSAYRKKNLNFGQKHNLTHPHPKLFHELYVQVHDNVR